MISPSYSITATERVLPSLALDFTTATLDARVTFTRSGNTATVTNSSGTIVGINADLPRFDFNPVSLACRGLLIEESRTNVLLNSLIDGTSLATQLVTVTAAARTLSFYGTGQIVLSGAHSATVTGTGAYPTRTTLTFTPSAGVLTLTVTGTVQFAQLETGAFATSFIPTAAASVTRSIDSVTMTGTNFSDWFNSSEGAFYVSADTLNTAGTRTALAIKDSGTQNFIFSRNIATGTASSRSFVSNVEQTSFSLASIFTANVPSSMVFAYKLNSSNFGAAGSVATEDTVCTIPTVDRLEIGAFAGVNPINGHIQKIMYWPQRLINAEVRAFSK